MLVLEVKEVADFLTHERLLLVEPLDVALVRLEGGLELDVLLLDLGNSGPEGLVHLLELRELRELLSLGTVLRELNDLTPAPAGSRLLAILTLVALAACVAYIALLVVLALTLLLLILPAPSALHLHVGRIQIWLLELIYRGRGIEEAVYVLGVAARVLASTWVVVVEIELLVIGEIGEREVVFLLALRFLRASGYLHFLLPSSSL